MASTVAGCVELMQALVPAFEPAVVESLEELEVGITWLDEADPLVRERVSEAAAHFPRSRPVNFEFPDPDENKLFMREVADVHRGLYPEYADDYGESIRWKLELCAAVTDGEVRTAERLRSEYRERCEQAFDGLDLLVTPTMVGVPPLATADERELRGRGIRLTYPFNCLGWPALAIPCGPAEGGLPASVQLVGRPGDDARVLAAGALLASPI
jgi:aspartyl-tRNA(Asn)/glutamyl-tRNA(Gln) amidotransferase subunit A